MILKPRTKGPWQNEHAHRETRRTPLKVEAWGRQLKSHAAEYGEHVDDSDTGYPVAVLKLFADAMKRCPPSISIDTKIMEGQPCVAGTRIPIRSVLRAVEHYGSIDGAVGCYPNLSTQQVQDALFFSQVILELPCGFDETSAAAR
jgi:uncharacterized protein (DUF433 family)